jgi:hypothetical protein
MTETIPHSWEVLYQNRYIPKKFFDKTRNTETDTQAGLH